MELLKAIGGWFKRKDREAAKALADPVSDSEIAIEEAQKQIGVITQAIAKYMAERRKIEAAIPGYKENIKKYNAAAEKAVDAGKDDLAEKALETVEQNENLLADAEKRMKIMDTDIAKMRNKLEKHKKLVRDAGINQKKLVAQHEMNQARGKLQKASAAFDKKSDSFGALSQLEDMVQTQEAEMDAMDELTTDASEELDDFMADSSTSDRLAALKAKKAKKKSKAKA